MFDLKLFANLGNIETKFEDFIKNFDLRGYIQYVQNNPTQLQAILESSYIHENGFYRITLWDNGINKLRLHIWDNIEGNFMENIHNHRWDLYSNILIGGYRNELYKRVQAGNTYYEYCYQPSADSQAYQLSYIGRSFLELINIDEKHQGNNVFLGHEDFHKVVPLTAYTASIFLSGQPQKTNTNVFSVRQFDQINFSYNYLKLTELKKLFSDFLTHQSYG